MGDCIKSDLAGQRHLVMVAIAVISIFFGNETACIHKSWIAGFVPLVYENALRERLAADVEV